MSETAPAKRPRHLMDPDNPRRPSSNAEMTQVQRWVLSSLAVTTILHLSAGLVIAAIFLDTTSVGPRVGLNLIAGAFGSIAVAAGLAIHGRSLANPWLLLGLVPTTLGLLLTF